MSPRKTRSRTSSKVGGPAAAPSGSMADALGKGAEKPDVKKPLQRKRRNSITSSTPQDKEPVKVASRKQRNNVSSGVVAAFDPPAPLSRPRRSSACYTPKLRESDSDTDEEIKVSKEAKKKMDPKVKAIMKLQQLKKKQDKKVAELYVREPYCKPPALSTILESDDEGGPISLPKENGMTVKHCATLNGSPAITGQKYVGAHVSAQGGLEKAVKNAISIGAKSFALFLRSQRKWEAKPIEEETCRLFKEAMTAEGFQPHLILPHGSYLLNLGAPNPDTLVKSRAALKDELDRCHRLGLTHYNFHPGSTCGKMNKQDCLRTIAESINMAHKAVPGVVTVIENMAGQGHCVGGDFEDLKAIIGMVRDKDRVGICLDTCHTFAAGYDLSTPKGYEKTFLEFDRVVGLRYLMAIHLNDSKGSLGCHLDRHENIGKGKLGLGTFERIMNDPRLNDIPLILETPCEDDRIYAAEIRQLCKMINQ